jgi:branched-chain amino acid transport system substrate-binding protein
MARRRLAVVFVAPFLAGASLAACGAAATGPSRGSGGSVVRIGVEAPLSGAQASLGRDIVRGVQLAVAEGALSSEGAGETSTTPPVTVPIETVTGDDRDDARPALAVARKMEARHVVAVVGPFGPSAASAVLPVYRKDHIAVLDLAPASSSSGYGASLVPTYAQAAATESQELVDVLHAQSVSVVYDPSDASSSQMAEALHELLSQAGVTVPAQIEFVPGGDPAAVVSRLQAAHSDAWYVTTPAPLTDSVTAAAIGVHVHGHCLVDLVAGSGPYSPSCLAAGVPSVAQMPGAAAYARAYSARFHAQPGPWGAFAYDSTRLLIDAATDAGTWRYGSLLHALAHATAIEGVTGELVMDPHTSTRIGAPVVVVDALPGGRSSIDPHWAAYSGYSGSP